MKKEKIKKTEKKQNKSASFFDELGCFMQPYKNKYSSSILISVLGVASSVASYAFVGTVAKNLFNNNIVFKNILILIVLAIVFKILHAILLNVSTWISHKAAYNTLMDIRNAISEKLLKLPMGYFEEHGSGRLKTMLVDHIEGMEKTLAHLLPEMTANLLAPLALMVWMFFIDWRLALMVIVWMVLGFSVTGGMMKGYEEKYAGQINALKGMNQAVVEYVNGIEVIKNFGRADECYNKYQDAVYGHAKYNVNWQKETQKYSALGMAIAPFSIFPVLIGGLIFYSKGSIDAGTLFLVIILTFGIFSPLMNAMNYFDQLAGMGTNAKEIKDVLKYPELKRGSEEKPLSSDVSFENVSFSYDGSDKKAVDNINFTVPGGTMFALVGPSGSGKSTIGKLAAGFWDCEGGTVKIGGRDIKDYTQEAINRLVSYVDQDTFLFDDTILNNIRLAKPNATRDEVIAVSKKAGCHQFISELPNGYDTVAGSGGQKLSGGERQRIAIARAMMKDAPIMVLDEATSGTDPENEALIQRSVSEAAKGKTLIVIAHRLPTVVNAQQIAFVKNNEIVKIGTHSELLKDLQDYKEMWEIGEGKNNA